MSLLSVLDARTSFGSTAALRGVSLELEPGGHGCWMFRNFACPKPYNIAARGVVVIRARPNAVKLTPSPYPVPS
jgi:hypothetical protein